MIAPQTNTDLKTIAQHMKELNSFVICGHVRPDGDCLGSQLALYHALRSLGKEVTCLRAQAEPFDEGLEFLPGIDEMVIAAEFMGEADAFVACDVPTLERMGGGALVHKRCSVTFTLDHHVPETVMSQYNYIDPDAASSSMIVWDLIKELGVEFSYNMALAAYTALLTDTGCFQFQNTDPAAFEAARSMIAVGISPSFVAAQVYQNRRLVSLELERLVLDRMFVPPGYDYALSYVTQEDCEQMQATKADLEPLITVMRSLEKIKAACLLREEKDCIRGSIRSKDETDVAALARTFGGGGHRAAAGFTIHTSLAEAIQLVQKALDEATKQEGNTCVSSMAK